MKSPEYLKILAMVKILLDGLSLEPGQGLDALEKKAGKKYSSSLKLIKILKKSIDARKKSQIIVIYRGVFSAPPGDVPRLLKSGAKIWEEVSGQSLEKAQDRGSKILVIGSGPGGLFAALRLSQRGLRCDIIEQGKDVDQRDKDIEVLRSQGVLDPQSNIVFGEGGAGTYSDGKLTTRIHKEGIEWVFDQLVAHGAQESILYDAKPHIGTDVLKEVVRKIRMTLQNRGCEFHFGQKAVEILSAKGAVQGVRCASGREFLGDKVLLACGHSSRDLYETLAEQGIALEPKGLAVGVRIEHPREFIDASQFGNFASKLPAADYRLTFNNQNTRRGTYSFCMCPGGEVVNSSSEKGRLCVNGMSYSDRKLPWSNAALVTTVTPLDWGSEVLGGIGFQRELEERAFKAGGGGFMAPAQRAESFMGRGNRDLNELSYLPGVTPGNFHDILPSKLLGDLVSALEDFDRKIPGFIAHGTLIGVETRTSSPVRILRNETFQSPSLKNLFPIGEGAGYAGGIISSAVDGVRAADLVSGLKIPE